MNIHWTIAVAAILGIQFTAPSLWAQETNPPIDTNALLRRIEELEHRVRVLDRKREIGEEAAAEKARTTPTVTIGSGGLVVRTPDTNFLMKIRGYAQVDGRFYADDESPTGNRNDTFLLRRVRSIIEGTVFDKYDYRLMLDFPSGSPTSAGNNGLVQDAYLNARLWQPFQIQVGKFKEPVGLERLQSGANLLFVERGFPTQLVPNRDVGLQVQGDLFKNRLRYELGIFNGTANGGSGDNEQADDEKDIAARLFATPFVNSDGDWLRGLGFGVSGTIGRQDGALRSSVTPGQQTFFSYLSGAGAAATPTVAANGEIWRVSPQAYYYKGPFGFFAEYVISSQNVTRTAGATLNSARLENTAWQVAASWFLTGEDNSFKAVTPLKPFVLGEEGWGALELVARYGQLDIDDDTFPLYANPASSASKATSWGVGVNWHLNRNVKLSLNYEHTDFDGGTSAFLDNGEDVILTRAQFSF
jgi:phosphate-selective porin OprO/OprP